MLRNLQRVRPEQNKAPERTKVASGGLSTASLHLDQAQEFVISDQIIVHARADPSPNRYCFQHFHGRNPKQSSIAQQISSD